MTLPIEELDFELCVTSGQVFRFERFERGGRQVWLGADGGNVIEAERTPEGWAVRSRPDGSAAQRFLRLDVSLAEVSRRVLEIEPSLAPLVARFPGLRTLRQGRADETLFSFLCTVNNNLKRIHRMVRVLGSFGNEIEPGVYEFPRPGRIVQIGEQRLREMGFGYRSRTIINVANELMRRPDGWLERLSEGKYADAVSALCELPGVGRKVADCVCLFGLGFDEAVPVDTHLWRVSVDRYFPQWRGGSLTEKRYKAVGDFFRSRFGCLAGFAHEYLFYDSITRSQRRSARGTARSPSASAK
jgi:N-glycosylase/DNA lyase